MQNKNNKTTPPETTVSTIGCMISFCLILFLFFPLWIFCVQIMTDNFSFTPYLMWLIPYCFLVLIAVLYRLLKKKSQPENKHFNEE
jgi:Ca2+/Na+ antiporter